MTAVKNVHIIDDDKIIRDSIGLLLTMVGYESFTYASAREFLQRAAQPIDGCLVTDVTMPEMSGIELMEKMKKLCLRLPVVVITGDADVLMAIEALRAGASDFLEKPFDGDELVDAVGAALAEKDAKQARESRAEASVQRFASLSAGERQIFAGLIAGQTNTALAEALDMSLSAVETCRARVLLKMDAHNLSEMVRMVLKADPGAFKL